MFQLEEMDRICISKKRGNGIWESGKCYFSKAFGLSVFIILSLFSTLSLAEGKTWTVNFKDTDIQEVIRFVAEVTEKTVIIDPNVKAKVQVISTKPVDRDQLYQLFLAMLEVHGFTAIEVGDVVRVIPIQDANTSPIPVVPDQILDKVNDVVTQVIQLENISATQLIPILRPLVPQQAHMAAYAPSNAIIISDTSANITRMREIIERIDRTAVAKTDVIKLEHASSEEVVQLLEQLQKKNRSVDGQAETDPLTIVADKRTNSVYISGDEMERQRVKSLLAYMDLPLQQDGNVRVIYLKYADAEQVSAVLSRVVENLNQGSGSTEESLPGTTKTTIEADKETNSLIITAETDVMSSLNAVIERLDIRRAQVLVEAIIVEMADINNRDLGIQWLFYDRDSNAYGGSIGNRSLATSLTPGALLAQGEGTGEDDPRVNLLQALANTPGQVLGVGRLDDALSFNVVVNALNQDSNANILSTPTLLTMDNQEASIVVGQNVPFITGSYTSTGGNSSSPDNPFQTIERENVGITLNVTPHINEGDSLVLEIVQEVSSLTGTGSVVNATDVITNERRIETQVLADNGQTIILGGLIQDDVQESEQKVPVLGDVPLLGKLFRNNSTSVSKTHLMVFLRSTIIRDSRTLAGATAEKYSYIRDMQQDKRDSNGDFVATESLPLLPEWKEQLDRLRELQQQPEELDASALLDMRPEEEGE